MIDIKQLHYFVAVAQQQHIGRAAELLHITQPPLSRQISLLEAALGVQLFIRHPKGVTLTAAGESFYKDSLRILASVSEACSNAQQIAQGKAGQLAVGFMMHAAYNIVPRLTKSFLQHYPDVALRLQEVIPSELAQRVQSGEFDAAVMLKPEQIHGLNWLKLCEENLVLALPAAHPLAHHSQLSASDLADEAFIATPQSVAPELRNALQHYGRRYGFDPKVILETQLQQTIVSLVAEGLGLALVPEPVTKIQLPGLSFRALPDAPKVEYGLLWRTDSLNPVLPRFIELASGLQAEVAQLSGR